MRAVAPQRGDETVPRETGSQGLQSCKRRLGIATRDKKASSIWGEGKLPLRPAVSCKITGRFGEIQRSQPVERLRGFQVHRLVFMGRLP
jgi:hypothetical protein